jgi:gluconolactonase
MQPTLRPFLLARLVAAALVCAIAALQAAPAAAQALRLSQVRADALPQQSRLFPPTLQLEPLFTGGCGVMEGMAAAADGRIFFTEITRSTGCADAHGVPGGRIWVHDPASGQTRVFREPSLMAAGLAIDAGGGLIAAEGADFGGRRVSRTDLATGAYRVLAYMFENRQFNAPNDVAVDPQGRIFFSDIRLFGPETIDQRIGGLYRIDPPGAGQRGTWPVQRVVSNNARFNGVEISADGRTLYAGLCELGSQAVDEQGIPDLPRNGPGGILAYEIRPDGALAQPRVWFDLEHGGCVDGMTTDADGELYATVNAAPAQRGIYVFSPAGELLALYQLPNQEIAVNLVFGRGEDVRNLYIATLGIGKIYRMRR